MRIKRIDHVAICVADVDAAKEVWERAFGLKGSVRETVASQKTDALLLPVGDTTVSGGCAPPTPAEDRLAAFRSSIELIAPQGNEGLEKFLQKRGPGLHHIAIEVEGIEQALATLKALGLRLIDETPRKGARGHKVAFIHPASTGGVLIELVEPDHVADS